MKEKVMGVLVSVCVMLAVAVGAFAVVSANAAETGSDASYRIQGYDNNSGDYIIAKYNVKDYGATGDGETDDTAAFTRLFSELRRDTSIPGAVVYVPAGRYKLTRSLTVPANVHLRGHWNNPKLGTTGEESVLLACVESAENEQAASTAAGLIVLNTHATITDMVIYYPEQSPDDIKPYPYSIYANSHMLSVRNITLINSYNGVQMGAKDKGSSHTVQNIYGTVLHRGVTLDFNYSDGVVQSIGFSSEYWKNYGNLSGEQVDKVKAFTKENATAVFIGKNDDYYVMDVDCPLDEFKEVFSVNYNYEADTSDGTPPFGYGVAIGLNGASTVMNKPEDYNTNNALPMPKDIDSVKGSEKFMYESVPDRFSTKKDIFNVKDYGASGKENDDSTFALSAALEEAEKNGGGVVYLPAGTYKVSAPLTVPRNVELRGESEDFWMGEATHIDVNWGKGKSDEAFITLSADSGIQGISFRTVGLYQEGVVQTLKTGVESMPEWAWMIRGAGKNVWLENVEFYNVMQGVDFASAACDNFVIRGIYGTALKQGAAIGGGTKGGRLENFQMSYSLWFEGEGRQISFNDFLNYTSHRMTGLAFGDCSDIIASNVGGFGLKNSVVLHEENGKVPTNLIFYKILADSPFGHNGFLAEVGDKISVLGLSTGVNSTMYQGETVGALMRVTDTFNGKMRVIVQNSWGNAKNVIADGKDVVVYYEGEQNTDMIEHNISFEKYPETIEINNNSVPPTQITETKNNTWLVFGICIAVAAVAIGAALLVLLLLKKKNG